MVTTLSHYKYMDIFPDPQEQLKPQSMVGSGRISNSSEILWLFFLPARRKTIQSNLRHKYCHNIKQRFCRSSRAANSVVSDGIWPKFELIQAYNIIIVLVTCKNGEDPLENECARWVTTILPLRVYGIFFQTLKGSSIRGRIWLNF